MFIELDKPREIRFGHKAIKMVKDLTKKDLTPAILQNISSRELEKVMYAGLKGADPDLDFSEVENILDTANYSYLIAMLLKCLIETFKGDEKTEKILAEIEGMKKQGKK